MSPDPRDWSISTALTTRDSTRVTPGEVAGFGRLVIRTDTPAPKRPRRRRRCREQRVIDALTAVVALGMAAWFALLLWAGAQFAHWLADAAVRLMGGA